MGGSWLKSCGMVKGRRPAGSSLPRRMRASGRCVREGRERPNDRTKRNARARANAQRPPSASHLGWATIADASGRVRIIYIHMCACACGCAPASAEGLCVRALVCMCARRRTADWPKYDVHSSASGADFAGGISAGTASGPPETRSTTRRTPRERVRLRRRPSRSSCTRGSPRLRVRSVSSSSRYAYSPPTQEQISGEHSGGDAWETRGRRVGNTWETRGRRVGNTWETRGRRVGDTWETRGNLIKQRAAFAQGDAHPRTQARPRGCQARALPRSPRCCGRRWRSHAHTRHVRRRRWRRCRR